MWAVEGLTGSEPPRPKQWARGGWPPTVMVDAWTVLPAHQSPSGCLEVSSDGNPHSNEILFNSDHEHTFRLPADQRSAQMLTATSIRI